MRESVGQSGTAIGVARRRFLTVPAPFANSARKATAFMVVTTPRAAGAQRARASRVRCRPELLTLETRTVPTGFTVNTLSDTPVVDIQTGKDAFGKISLRSAIMAANASEGGDI